MRGLRASGVNFAVGVPDSLLKPLNRELGSIFGASFNVTAVNEGAAVGQAIGSFLSTGDPALVYLQNSGLGNALNPLLSLADPSVYGIPLILAVGLRGEPDEDGFVRDEPQHVAQGRCTEAILDSANIPFFKAKDSVDQNRLAADVVRLARSRNGPVAVLFSAEDRLVAEVRGLEPAGQDARQHRLSLIQSVVAALPPGAAVIATTGYMSRALCEFAGSNSNLGRRWFPCVGGMGHAVSVAEGLARSLRGNHVCCLDGDGAMLMHMGALATAAKTDGFLYVVLNNGRHMSVGGQPTVAHDLDVVGIGRSLGFGSAVSFSDFGLIESHLGALDLSIGSHLIEVRCDFEDEHPCPRPPLSPGETLGRWFSV